MNVLSLPAVATTLMAEEPARGPEFGKAGPIGLLIILILLAVVFLLIRSMNSHLKKLPESFDTENPGPDQEFDVGTDRGASSPDATSDSWGTDSGSADPDRPTP